MKVGRHSVGMGVAVGVQGGWGGIGGRANAGVKLKVANNFDVAVKITKNVLVFTLCPWATFVS